MNEVITAITKKKGIIKKGMILVCSLLVLFYCLAESLQWYQLSVQESIAGKVIRFHVLANSDEQKDQEVKLKVRDGISNYMQELLADSDSIETSRQIITANLFEITQKANELLKEQGVDYKAIASLGNSTFPEKEYEGLVFPAGEYEALKIQLGKGQGHNWWCVMYPNLCFSNAVYKMNQKEWKRLKKTLAPKEYKQIMNSKNYTIRWKLLEHFMKKR